MMPSLPGDSEREGWSDRQTERKRRERSACISHRTNVPGRNNFLDSATEIAGHTRVHIDRLIDR